MDDIKQYVLLAESTNTKIEHDINALLSQGWKLHGYTWIHDSIFFQAMTHHIPSKKPSKTKKK
jgi:hypothetical protein